MFDAYLQSTVETKSRGGLGRVSFFVEIFAIMPIARSLFKQMNVPWILFIAALYFGISSAH